MTPDAMADLVQWLGFRTVARERVPDLQLKNLETQKLSRLRTMERIQ